MSNGAVIFDGDDTLWKTEFLYDQARDEAARLVAEAGLDPAAFADRQRELDVLNVKRFGLSSLRFPTSSVEAYESLAVESGIGVSERLREDVFYASSSVFDLPAPLYEGVEEVLRSLKGEIPLGLLTKGDTEVQGRRIAASGLSKYFDDISIVANKAADDFRTSVTRLGSLPADAWSIGNSIGSDIHPAIEVGMKCIWIDAYVWAHERRQPSEIEGNPRIWVASEIREVLDIVRDNPL